MPIVLPPNAPVVYDSADTVLNFARVIANDAAISLAGDDLADSQPYTFTLLNLAWRKLQVRLGNNAIEEFPQEVILTNIATNALLVDIAARIYMNFSIFFDGVNNLPAPILPSDLDLPIRLWERPSNSPNARFEEMVSANDGLPDVPRSSRLGQWEWRDDALYFIGSTAPVDIRMRYRRDLPDIQSQGANQVPLIRCAVALAYLVVEAFVVGRGSTVTPLISAEKEQAIIQLINSTTRKKQHSNFRRIPYSRRNR